MHVNLNRLVVASKENDSQGGKPPRQLIALELESCSAHTYRSSDPCLSMTN